MHKVGDTVWVFDHNRIVRDSSGLALFREKFRPAQIVGETSRSWVVGPRGLKIPKAGGDVRVTARDAYGATRVYMTQEAVDAEVLRHDHQYRIAKAVEACTDTAVLRQVAALVGYKIEG